MDSFYKIIVLHLYYKLINKKNAYRKINIVRRARAYSILY